MLMIAGSWADARMTIVSLKDAANYIYENNFVTECIVSYERL